VSLLVSAVDDSKLNQPNLIAKSDIGHFGLGSYWKLYLHPTLLVLDDLSGYSFPVNVSISTEQRS